MLFFRDCQQVCCDKDLCNTGNFSRTTSKKVSLKSLPTFVTPTAVTNVFTSSSFVVSSFFNAIAENGVSSFAYIKRICIYITLLFYDKIIDFWRHLKTRMKASLLNSFFGVRNFLNLVFLWLFVDTIFPEPTVMLIRSKNILLKAFKAVFVPPPHSKQKNVVKKKTTQTKKVKTLSTHRLHKKKLRSF